jgi:hypothetical protein
MRGWYSLFEALISVYSAFWRGECSMSTELDELIKRAANLSDEERLRLIDHLRRNVPTVRAGRRWREIRGSAPFPLLGEDAQTWVSRNRHEEDEHRRRHLRNDQ